MGDCTVALVRGEGLGWGGIRAALDQAPGFRVVGDVLAFEQLAEALAGTRPRLLIAGENERGDARLGWLARWAREHPDAGILFLGERFRPSVYSALGRIERVGGYLLLPGLRPDVLLSAIDLILTGRVAVLDRRVRQELAEAVAATERELAAHRALLPALTERERAVLAWLAEGLTQAEVAVRAGLSPRTVVRIVQGLQSRFGTSTMFTLGMYAEMLGIAPAATAGGQGPGIAPGNSATAAEK